MSERPEPEAAEGGVLAALTELASERFSRGWLLILLMLVILTFFWMVRIFVTPFILAAVFVVLAYPMHEGLVRLLRGHRSTAALLSCFILILGILIPFYITSNLVVAEAMDIYQATQPQFESMLARSEDWLAEVERWRERLPAPLSEQLPATTFESIDWNGSIQTLSGSLTNLLADIINRTSRGTAQVAFGLFVVIFTMYYLFRDGARAVDRLRYLSPLDAYYEDLLVNRLISVSRATLRGSIILGFVQGGIGAITLAICGVPSAILWGIAMIVLSVIPLVGTWLVMYPIALVQALQGHWVVATVIVVVTAGLISNIDNLLRPRLIGRGAGMHDLLVFFATLGGISVYGVMGFVVGPIIGALFVAMLDIYALEFKPDLERPPRVRDAHMPTLESDNAAKAKGESITPPG
jgi:predicted PurR-regulated permease PerM